MKSHLIVKLAPDSPALGRRYPHWRAFIQDKSHAVHSLTSTVDREFARLRLPFWVTQEYAPAVRGGWTQQETAAGLDRVFRLILQQAGDLPAELIARLRLSTELEEVRPVSVEASYLPERATAQSYGRSFDRSRERIGVPEAHLFGRGDSSIRVAILDTGIDSDHPELRDRIVASADFVHLEGMDTSEFIGDFLDADQEPDDEIGHGSHVAGIIAGAGRQMPRGVAPDTSLIAVRTLATLKAEGSLAGAGIVDNINVAMKWAVDQGAHVINASLGIRHEGGGLPHEEVVRYALSRGVTVVAASGNDGTAQKYYPGALPGVIAVGAADESGQVASFSSYGAPVALLAPGTNIMSCDATGSYQLASGTSQASPFVAGAAALLRGQAASLGVAIGDAEVKAILRHTSDRPGPDWRRPRTGYGELNLADACRLLRLTLERSGALSHQHSSPRPTTFSSAGFAEPSALAS